jgi:hypothetical protein
MEDLSFGGVKFLTLKVNGEEIVGGCIRFDSSARSFGIGGIKCCKNLINVI